MYGVITGPTVGVNGRGKAGDWDVIPVTRLAGCTPEACGRFTPMTVLPLFRGEIYHLG